MNSFELNRALLDALPSLRDGYDDLQRLWGGEEPGAHITYGDLLVPYIERALSDSSVTPRLASALSLIEALAETGDEYATTVVVTSVLERLVDITDRSKLNALFGPHTSRLWQRMLKDFH